VLGECNDAIENAIMQLKREVIDKFQLNGIYKFILVGENVLNFHSGDRDYYEEWYEEMCEENGWAVLLNMPEQTQHDFRKAKLNRFIELVELGNWRTFKPFHLFRKMDEEQMKRLS
jgi:MFS superfamily sulfate permease-like transporter